MFFYLHTRLYTVNSSKTNAPTLKCPSTNESYGGAYRLKAELITADELVLGGGSYQVEGDSYLVSGLTDYFFYSMTPSMRDPIPLASDFYIKVWSEDGYTEVVDVTNVDTIRPVINVSISGDFTSGDGTATNPYVLS